MHLCKCKVILQWIVVPYGPYNIKCLNAMISARKELSMVQTVLDEGILMFDDFEPSLYRKCKYVLTLSLLQLENVSAFSFQI